MSRIKSEIQVRYEYIETPEAQERLDDIFDYIFDETIGKKKFDNLQKLSHTYNNLVKKDNYVRKI